MTVLINVSYSKNVHLAVYILLNGNTCTEQTIRGPNGSQDKATHIQPSPPTSWHAPPVEISCWTPPLKKVPFSWGAWVAQWVKHPTSAQVMISRLVGSSPASGSVLTARRLEPAPDSVSPSVSAPLPAHTLSLSLSLSLLKNK